MTRTLIDVIRAYLLDRYHLMCDRSNFLILDSTSAEKFSRHVIFTMKDMSFKDNSHVGRFIRTICSDITLHLESDTQTHKILSHFDKANIEEMLVETNRGKRLFIDDGVYTKNRHFRLYLSTKWGKESYLTIPTDCAHIPVNNCREKDLGIFLDSLISYFPNKDDLILLEFVDPCNVKTQFYTRTLTTQSTRENDEQASPYPEVDRYVRSIVDPGTIRVARYSAKMNTLRYEIYGNRYTYFAMSTGTIISQSFYFAIYNYLATIMTKYCAALLFSSLHYLTDTVRTLAGVTKATMYTGLWI